MSALDEVTSTISSVAEKIGPAVVGVNRHGTGVVVADGFIVTNAHNLRGDATYVTFADGRALTGTQAGVDLDGDLAVVAVDTAGIAPVEFSTTPVAVGQVVVALSNPRGRGLRATIGTVSSTGRGFRGPRGRRIPGSIEHTAPLARGSSGGPVLDREGRVVGVNTNRVQEGFYQAITANAELKRRIDALSKGEAPVRRRLGTAIAPPHITNRLRAAAGLPEVEGLLVRGVEEASPADRAGLLRGDVLVRAGDIALTSVDALYEALDLEGDSLELSIVRATDELTVTVSFAA
ncbi:MAG: S1C family serine protease [Acidimicrobiales bacterium]